MRTQRSHVRATILEMSSSDELLLEIAPADVDRNLQRCANRSDELRRVPLSPVHLRASRHRFGWSLTARFEMQAEGGDVRPLERVIHHEVMSPHRVRVLSEVERPVFGNACESDPAYRWLELPSFAHTSPWDLPAVTSVAMHRARRAIERFRLRALDAADVAVHRLDLDADAIAHVPADLLDAVLQCIEVDRSGRLAPWVEARPQMVCALAIALGDAPERWVSEGVLAAPLQLATAGWKERDVLAAAIETGRGVAATKERVQRLSALASLVAHSSVTGRARERWARLGAALEVDCPVSWLSDQPGGIGRWALAQSWADSLSLPSDGRRYAARYGGLVAYQFWVDRMSRGFAAHALEAALRSNAHALLRDRVKPAAVVARHLLSPFPQPLGMLDRVVHEGVEVVRIPSGEALARLGRRFRNCLASRGYSGFAASHLGKAAYYEARWEGGEGVVEVWRTDEGWRLSQVEGPKGVELDSETTVRVVAAVMRAVPDLDIAPAAPSGGFPWGFGLEAFDQDAA